MSLNILIVDDSPIMRRVVRSVVDLSGFEVAQYLQAGDGIQALHILRSHPVHLVISDINMPRMDGEQLLIAVRHDAALAHIPVIILSTDQSAVRMDEIMAHGASGYIPKPFRPAVLCEQIDRLLAVPAQAIA